MKNRKRTAAGLLLYITGCLLFIIAQSAVVSGSPIALSYAQRVALCSMAVTAIAAAPFVFMAKNPIGRLIAFTAAAGLIYCIIAWGGFKDNRIAALIWF